MNGKDDESGPSNHWTSRSEQRARTLVPKFGTRYRVQGEASRGSSFPTHCTMRITLPGRIISL